MDGILPGNRVVSVLLGLKRLSRVLKLGDIWITTITS